MSTWEENFDLAKFRKISKSFLHDVLKISDKVNVDLESLRRLANAYESIIPWHNIDLLATNEDERSVPMCDEIINAVSTKRGGLCWTHNVFFKFFLESLGFNMEFLIGNILGGTIGEHIASACTIGDKRYLVDVGMGYIGFPVLDFPPKGNTEHWSGDWYPGIMCSARFEMDSNSDVVKRIHKSFSVEKGEEEVFGRFFLGMPTTFEVFANVMGTQVYTKRGPNTCRLLDAIRAVRMENDAVVAFFGTDFTSSKKGEPVKKEKIPTKEEFARKIVELFPELDSVSVTKAVNSVSALVGHE